MFKIAICDDDIKLCSEIERIVLEYCKSISFRISVEVYTSGNELIKYIKRGENCDLLFLDIEMPKINGVEVGKKIRNEINDEITQIVYVSSKANYAMQLFEIRPMNFVVKPFTRDRIIQVLTKAIRLSNALNKYFSYKQGRNVSKTHIKDIIYFESMDRKIKMVTVDDEIIFYGSLEKVFEEIGENGFMYIHKSYIVNYAHVIEFKYEELTMSNKECLPISQSKRGEIRKLQLELEKKEFSYAY